MRKTEVRELAEQIRGVSYKPEDLRDSLGEDSVILLRANNISDGMINFDDVVYVDKRKVSKDQYLKIGDVLICASSGSKALVGKAASVDFSKICTFGAFCKVIRPKDGFEGYLGVFFQSAVYRKKISEVAIGVNINNIRNEHIDDIELPLYSEKENEDIVKRISVLRGIIAKRKIELNELDILIKARFVEIFGDPYINPYGWKKLKIKDAVTVEPQNGLYKPQSDYVTDGTGTPILRIDGFYDGVVTSFSSLKRLNCEIGEKQRYLLYENDIVINRVNSIEYLGKCAHIKGLLEDTVYESNMMRMHFDEKRFEPVYISKLLCSAFMYDQILNHAKKAVNQASINQKDVLDFDIYQPPLELQNQFAAFVHQVGKLKAAVQKSLDETQILFDSLMQQYFG